METESQTEMQVLKNEFEMYQRENELLKAELVDRERNIKDDGLTGTISFKVISTPNELARYAKQLRLQAELIDAVLGGDTKEIDDATFCWLIDHLGQADNNHDGTYTIGRRCYTVKEFKK